MIGYHVLDSKPKTALGEKFALEDYELLCLIISALSYKKNNGKIGLVADKTAIDFLSSVCSIYDEVLMLPDMSGIDNIAFWAAAKIFALKEIKTPLAIIDTDFIVWDKLNILSDVTVAHKEPINTDVYPDFDSFNLDSSYSFNKNWDKNILPCNTAFMAFNNEDFKNYYADSAIEFMRASKNPDSTLTYMVFAEQRIISLCANEKNININTLMDYDKLGSPDYRFTHLWGYKQILKTDLQKRNEFCVRCAKRIENDFPEVINTLLDCDTINKFFRR